MKPPILFALALMMSSGLLGQDRPREQNPPEAPRAETTLNVPTRVDFQGRLAGSEGQPVNANLLLTFCLYDVATGGTALWCESQYADVTDGLFQVSLGVSNPLYPNLFSQPDRWIGIAIESEPEMAPRTPFSSVGYALQAAENDPTWNGNANATDPISRLGNVGIGLSETPAKLSILGLPNNPEIPGISSTGLLSLRPGAYEAIDIGKMGESPFTGWIQAGYNLNVPDPLALNPLGGNVGIGTTTPSQLLDVNGNFRVRGHLFDYDNTSGTNGQVLTRGASGVLWQTPAASPWLSSGSNIYFNAGMVGIGTSSIEHPLSIENNNNTCYIKLKDNQALGGMRIGAYIGELALINDNLNKNIRFVVNTESGYFQMMTLDATNKRVGILTTTPDASLDVEGTVVIGPSGKVFSEIREITGTTAAAGGNISFAYPSGYTMSNIRVLSVEINYLGNAWIGMGGNQQNTSVNERVFYYLDSTKIWIYFPPVPDFQNRAFRMMVMKVQ